MTFTTNLSSCINCITNSLSNIRLSIPHAFDWCGRRISINQYQDELRPISDNFSRSSNNDSHLESQDIVAIDMQLNDTLPNNPTSSKDSTFAKKKIKTSLDVLNNLPANLQKIIIEYNNVKDFTNLIVLMIKKEKEISTILAQCALKITNLDIKNEHLSHKQIAILLDYCKNLEILKMPCYIANDDITVVTKLKKLHFLDLSNCDKLTDIGFAKLMELTNLKELNLSKCTLSIKSIFSLRKLFLLKNFKGMNLSGFEHDLVEGCRITRKRNYLTFE